MFKKLLGLTAVTFIALTSLNANAAFVHHDIYLDNVSGDAFGISDGFAGVVGFLEFDTVNANAQAEVDASLDPMFNFEINLGGTIFTMADDIFGDAWAAFEYPITVDGLLNNLQVFFADLIDINGNEVVVEYDVLAGANYFDAIDAQGNYLFGDVSFVNSSVVPEPPMFALVLVGLLAIRRFSKK